MISKRIFKIIAASVLAFLSIPTYLNFQYGYEIWLAKQILSYEGSFRAAVRPRKYVYVMGTVSGKPSEDLFISTIVSNGNTNGSGLRPNGCFNLRSLGPMAIFSFYAPKYKTATHELSPGYYLLNVSLAPKEGKTNSTINISEISFIKYIQGMQKCIYSHEKA